MKNQNKLIFLVIAFTVGLICLLVMCSTESQGQGRLYYSMEELQTDLNETFIYEHEVTYEENGLTVVHQLTNSGETNLYYYIDDEKNVVHTSSMVFETNRAFLHMYNYFNNELVTLGPTRWAAFYDWGVVYVDLITVNGHPYPDIVFSYELQ